MIIEEYVDIKINKSNYNYYNSILNNIEKDKVCKIPIKILKRGSHIKILVSCDICKCESKKPYRQYMDSFEKSNIYCCSPKCAQFKNKITNYERYGVDNVFQCDEIKNKIKETNLYRYNVSYPSQSKEIREKITKTLNKNYGVINPMFSDEIKHRLVKTCLEKYNSKSYLSCSKMTEFRIQNKTKIPEKLKSEYIKYRDIVRKITNQVKIDIMERWDGYDFYDGEYIKDNFKYKFYDKRYPTMDHKISIYYGFENKIDHYIIANIDNIVITKRSINSSKSTKSNF